MRDRHASTAVLRDNSGFTLIEVLVAMISATIVIGALVLLLEVTINQTSRINETSTANQLGRVTMNKITDELQSSCLELGFHPVQATSTEQDLKFVDAFTESSEVPASATAERSILWSESAHTLTESTITGTGTAPHYVWSGTATTKRIGEQITKGQAGGNEVPIFRYYRYSSSGATGTNETPESALSLIVPEHETTTLGATTAGEVAAVVVTFKGGVSRDELLSNEKRAKEQLPTELSDQVTFAFAAPAAEATIKDEPCN